HRQVVAEEGRQASRPITGRRRFLTNQERFEQQLAQLEIHHVDQVHSHLSGSKHSYNKFSNGNTRPQTKWPAKTATAKTINAKSQAATRKERERAGACAVSPYPHTSFA